MASIPNVNHAAANVGSGKSLSDYGRLMRRRWKYPALIIPAFILIAVLLAYILPVSYRAAATIMLEPSSIPKELINSTVHDIQDVPGYAQQELEIVRRRIMTPERLIPLIKSMDPYPDHPEMNLEAKAVQVAQDTSVERVDPITGKPLDQSTAFAIYYLNSNRKMAGKFEDKIIELFLTYNRITRAEGAAAAYEFLHSQAKDLESSMLVQEQKLSSFREKFGGSLPEMQSHNLNRIDSLEHDLQGTQQQLLAAEQKESELQLQLNGIAPSLTSSVSDYRIQLAKMKSDLIDAEQKYTPEHPEVKRLQRAIKELQVKGGAAMQLGAAAPDNPDYLVVKSQLDSEHREVERLHAQEARSRADMSSYEKNLTTAPDVQREYTALTRDYDNSRARYEDLQLKMKNAALAQTMESEAKGEKFSLLHETAVPHTPYYPNRLGIILLGIVLGCGIAFGAAAMVDASDPSVRGNSDLAELMATETIGVVPLMLNPTDRRRRRFAWATTLVVYGAATAFVASIVLRALV